MVKELLLAVDCKSYKSDVPCNYHKNEGSLCKCPHYSPVRQQVVVVKLDALGDVLRTTAILAPLRRQYPESRVTWVTKGSAVEFFRNNPFVDQVLDVRSAESVIELQSSEYDLVLNPDANRLSAQLATFAAKGKSEVRGFFFEGRAVTATNEAAREWQYLGNNDALKKANDKSYHYFVCNMLGLDYADTPIYVRSEQERNATRLLRAQLFGEKRVVCLNIGSGERWPMKRWSAERFVQVAKRLLENDVGVLISAGPDEKHLTQLFDPARFRAIPSDLGIREYAQYLDTSDVVVSGDTMPLHLSAALGKRVLALFGPTSMVEIAVHDGEKIGRRIDCHTCYKRTCDRVDTCMTRISVEDVFGRVQRLLCNLSAV